MTETVILPSILLTVLQESVPNKVFVVKRFLGQCHENSGSLFNLKPRSCMAYSVLNMVGILQLPIRLVFLGCIFQDLYMWKICILIQMCKST